MARKFLLAASALGLWAMSGAAQASGDGGCDIHWRLFDKTCDCQSRAILAPANDTRVNLLVLLRDRTGLGTGGLAYPKPNWDNSEFGHTFLDWKQLRTTLYPPHEAAQGQSDDQERIGSRCDSLVSGKANFVAALSASRGVSAFERDKLTAMRGRLETVCSIGPAAALAALLNRNSSGGSEGSQPALPDWPADIASAPGRAFLGYLQASDSFYGERWDEARSGFAGLSRSQEPWVAEASAYMLARVDLNAAIVKAFDDYGYFQGQDGVDRPAVARAGKALADYLKAWPQGRYAGSAQGLQRRVLWLQGDTAALGREYERLLLTVPGKDEQAAMLVQEIDNKLLFPQGPARDVKLQGQLLLAAQDLLRMRDDRSTGGEGIGPLLTADALNAQQANFADQPQLWSFLQASHAFYVGKDLKRVLQLIPDDARQSAYAPLAFSRQMLRGMALAGLGDRNEAGFWLEMLPGATALWQRPMVELALALNYERNGKLAAVFAGNSPITDSDIRIELLHHSAGPEILRAQALDTSRPLVERNAALDTLLNRQLNHGDFAGFLASLPINVSPSPLLEGGSEPAPVTGTMFREGTWSDGYQCAALIETARTLARNPQDLPARLCLGDFWRINAGAAMGDYEAAPAKDELGGALSGFTGEPLARGQIYAAIIADPRAPARERAYALYRAVNCYAPGKSNQCGGSDVAPAQRRAWFQQLKREYPTSEWAAKLRYYW